MLTPFEIYKLFFVISLHFSDKDYDVFKYNWKTRNLSEEAFQKNRNRWSFVKLSETYPGRDQFINFLVSNFIEMKTSFIDPAFLNSDEAKKIYANWKKRNQSLSYTFRNDMETLMRESGGYPDNFMRRNSNGTYGLFSLVKNDDISLESFLILDMMFGFTKKWNKYMENNDIWAEYYWKFDKYKPFISVDLTKFQNILKNSLKELA